MKETFTQSVAKLTVNQQVVLAAVLRGESVQHELNERGWQVYPTNTAKDRCSIKARGIGAVIAGIGKRTVDDDNIMYLKDEWSGKSENGKHAIAINRDVFDEALNWAKEVPENPSEHVVKSFVDEELEEEAPEIEEEEEEVAYNDPEMDIMLDM